MSQLQNDLSAAEKLPREPRDSMTTDANMAEWKQRVIILDVVQQLEQLTVEEKEILVQIIRSNADQVNALLAQSGTVDEFYDKLVSLARTTGQADALGDGTNDAPMHQAPEEPAASPALETALHKIFAGSKKQIATASVEHMAKLFTALKKKPSDKKNRVHNTSNIIIKKHILSVPGAEEFFCAVGFKKAHEAAKEVFTIAEADVNVALLDAALNAISHHMGDKEEQKVAAPGKRVLCAAGCGFWGEEKTEDMCSVCYKKKYFGAAAVAAVGPSKEPTKCIRGCGFWGADKFGGMCSVCFHKEHPEGLPKPQVKNWRKRLVIVKIKIRAMRRFQEAGNRRKQPNRKICYVKSCKRKLGITGIECKCGFVFCGQHRYAYAHECTYDYKGAHQKVLNAQNPSLKRDKAPGS